MKKLSSVILVAVMALAMASCSDAKTIESSSAGGATTTTTADSGSSDASSEGSSAEAGSVDYSIDTSGNFVFNYEGVDILLGSDPDATIAALGDAKSVLDVPSCAHDGTDHIYTYTNAVVTVYVPTGSDKGYISDVLVTSDLISTPEGLEIGMTKEDCRSKYGDPDEDSDVTWIYTRGTSQLMITFDGEKIKSIEYMIP